MGLFDYIEELKKKIDIETNPQALEELENELMNAEDFAREKYGPIEA